MSTLDVSRVRPALQSIERTFAAGVLAPEVLDALNGLGLGLDGVGTVNLVTRTAAMGAVTADVAIATFYNPNPDLVRSVIPSAWDKASPDKILATQLSAFAPVLTAALEPMDRAELAELAQLSRTVGNAAAESKEGRPLFAGMVSQGWPDDDGLAVWQAAKLLREHRGDGHIAGLVVEGLSGIDALVIHAAWDSFPADALRMSRQWPQEPWDASVASLRQRGWLTDDETLTFTADGRNRRKWIEDRTDELAAVAYEPIGNAGVERMIELGTKLTEVLASSMTINMQRPPQS